MPVVPYTRKTMMLAIIVVNLGKKHYLCKVALFFGQFKTKQISCRKNDNSVIDRDDHEGYCNYSQLTEESLLWPV